MATLKGIDVSKHNGKIDWAKVKSAGIDFAMLRSGYGSKTVDPTFAFNAKQCNSIGIPIGIYWFSYAYTVDMAKSEALKCIEIIKQLKIDFPVAFDFEGDSLKYAEKQGVKLSYSLISQMANVFLQTIKAAGYKPILYSNRSMLKAHFAQVKDFEVWYANPSLTKPDQDCSIWQYSFSGKVNGIKGNVDLNYSYIDYVKSNIDKYKAFIQSKCNFNNPDEVWTLLDKHKSAESLYKKLANSYNT